MNNLDFVLHAYTLVLMGIGVGIVAYVYSEVLTAPGMILEWWYNFLYNTIGPHPCTGNAKYPNLWKAVIGCYKCVAGQMAFWLYLFYYWQSYSLFAHLFIISYAIFTALIVYEGVKWFNKSPLKKPRFTKVNSWKFYLKWKK